MTQQEPRRQEESRLQLPGEVAHRLKETDIRACFVNRRSRRNYVHGTMTKRQLAYILYHTMRKQRDEKVYHTAIPSAGNRHPLDVELLLLRVLDVEKGLYRYDPITHTLVLRRRFDELESTIEKALPTQKFVKDAALIYAITARREKMVQYVGEEAADKLIYLEAGHLGQQIMLLSESLELGTCPVAEFDGIETDRLFSVDEGQHAIYLFPMGPRADLF